MPQIDGRLTIEPEVLEQELVSPDESGHKYEATVTGTLHGRPVNGYSTIELVGAWLYGGSSTSPRLTAIRVVSRGGVPAKRRRTTR